MVCIDNINREYSGIDSHTYQWQDLMNTLNKNCELDYLEPDVWHVDDHAEYVFNNFFFNKLANDDMMHGKVSFE
jgi:hypothetical protein